MNNFNVFFKTLSIVAILALLSACGGVPEKDSILQNAKTAIDQLKADPQAHSLAATYDAEKALEKAENAKDAEEMRYLAYLTEKQAEIASETAKRKAAEAEVVELGKRRDEMQLSAREREIDSKSREAEIAKEQAQMALDEAAALSSKNKQLQDQLNELKGKQTDKGLMVTLGDDVLFSTGKSDLLPGAQRTIGMIVSVLKQQANRNVLVEGHTDSRGTDEFNLDLSERRANAVREALIMQGIAPERILARGLGESRPVADDTTDAGMQQNRRVEITILNEGEVLKSPNTSQNDTTP
jgi:outer membrane protein OmpA-like peptidoglycan-associated protein